MHWKKFGKGGQISKNCDLVYKSFKKIPRVDMVCYYLHTPGSLQVSHAALFYLACVWLFCRHVKVLEPFLGTLPPLGAGGRAWGNRPPPFYTFVSLYFCISVFLYWVFLHFCIWRWSMGEPSNILLSLQPLLIYCQVVTNISLEKSSKSKYWSQ